MKYKFWDKYEQKWFKPVYKADKEQFDELLVTQNGDVLQRKFEDGQIKIIDESTLQDRFIKCLYSGARDVNEERIYQFDIVQDAAGKNHLIDFKKLTLQDKSQGTVYGFWIPENCVKIGNKFQNPEMIKVNRK